MRATAQQQCQIPYVYIHIYIYIYSYIYIYVYIHTCILLRLNSNVKFHIYVHIYICICIYIYIHIYSHTHVHTHTQIPVTSWGSGGFTWELRINNNVRFRWTLYQDVHTYKWVMSHVWMSHVTHVNESYHTWHVTLLIRVSAHDTRMNESCLMYEWVMSHVWMSHVSHNTSHDLFVHVYTWHTCEWVISHVWMSHVTHQQQCQIPMNPLPRRRPHVCRDIRPFFFGLEWFFFFSQFLRHFSFLHSGSFTYSTRPVYEKQLCRKPPFSLLEGFFFLDWIDFFWLHLLFYLTRETCFLTWAFCL